MLVGRVGRSNGAEGLSRDREGRPLGVGMARDRHAAGEPGPGRLVSWLGLSRHTSLQVA